MSCSSHHPRVAVRQYKTPCWEPLVAAVGEHLAEGFMWMHEATAADGSAIHAYKHSVTRRYLYLGEEGGAFEAAPCGAFVPQRLDFAIRAALCTWWLGDGTDADRDAIRAAIERAFADEHP